MFSLRLAFAWRGGRGKIRCIFAWEKILMYLCPCIRGVAQPGSASQWGCGGRWFESSHSDECKWRSRKYFPAPFFVFGRCAVILTLSQQDDTDGQERRSDRGFYRGYDRVNAYLEVRFGSSARFCGPAPLSAGGYLFHLLLVILVVNLAFGITTSPMPGS